MTEVQRIYEGMTKIDQIKSLQSTENIDMRGKDIPKGVMYEVGCHAAHALKRLGQGYCLLSGDGRISTPMIIDELSDALTRQGIDVIDAGYANITPLFEVERSRLGVSGINVTASHQSFEYNGLKIVLEANPQVPVINSYSSERNGHAVYHDQDALRQHYLEDLLSRVQGIQSKRTVAFDALQGSSFPFFAHIAQQLGISYVPIRFSSNGYFPLTESGPDPGRVANFAILQALTSLEPDSLTVMVDGDGDRMGAAQGSRMIPAPYLGALRALQAGEGKFVMEYCLASIVKDFLAVEGIEVVPVKRSRPSLISAIQNLGGDATGGQELSLHPFNKDGVDDAIEAAFRLIAMQDDLAGTIERIRTNTRSFIPELRVKTSRPSKPIVEEVYKANQEDYVSALLHDGKLADGIIVEHEDHAIYIRGSSNENALTVNLNAQDPEALPGFLEKIAAQVDQVEPGSGSLLEEEYQSVGGVVQ